MDWESWLPMLLIGGGSSALMIFLMMQLMQDGNGNSSANDTVQTVTTEPTESPASLNAPNVERALLPEGYYYAVDVATGEEAIFKEGVLGPVGDPTLYEDTVRTENDVRLKEASVDENKAKNESGWRMALEYGAAGAGIGAIAGTIVPGIGNAVGAIGGALIGGALGLGGAAIAEANGGDPWPFW